MKSVVAFVSCSVLFSKEESLFSKKALFFWNLPGKSGLYWLKGNREGRNLFMQVIVIKSPKYLTGILKMIFKIH